MTINTLTGFFLILALGVCGQTNTIKFQKTPRVKLCGLDTGVISAGKILKNPVLELTPSSSEYKIKSFEAIIHDTVHMMFSGCRGAKLCTDLLQELKELNKDKHRPSVLRLYNIVLIDNRGDTLPANTIGVFVN